MRRIPALTSLAVFSLALSSAVHSDPSTADPDLVALTPFDTSTAQENLLYCEPSLTQDDMASLSRVNYIYYDFVPPRGVTADPNSSIVTTKRVVSFSLPEMSVSALEPKVRGFNQSSCEADLKTSGLNLSLADRRHVRAQFHVSLSLRKCGHFLGIPYKTDVGDGSADIAFKFRVNDDLSIVQDGVPEVFNVQFSVNWFFKLVGPLFGLPAEASFIIGDTFKHLAFDQMRTYVSTAVGDAGTQDIFKAFNAARGSILRYTQTLEALPASTMTLDTTDTGIERDPASGNFNFILTQTNSSPIFYGGTYYDNRKGEIHFINHLRDPRPRYHTVVSGDNIWNIAKQYEIDPYSYIYIEDINNVRGKKLRPGQTLEIPGESEFCHKVQIEDAIVRPGDSLYSISKRKAFAASGSQLRSHNQNLIYPYERIMLAN